MALTDTAIRAAKAEDKARKLFDGDGLFLFVTPTGTKSWRLKYRYMNKEKLLALGLYPQVSLKDARERAAAARKWWMGELARRAKTDEIELEQLPVTPQQIVELQQLVDDGKINDKIARQVLEGILAGEGDAGQIVADRGLEVVSDDGPLLAVIDEVLAAQPDIVEKIKSGNLGPIGAVIGAVMKATRGQADAGRVRELVLERIG